VKRIKATCKIFPRSARGRPTRHATATQLIAELHLDPGETSSAGPASDSIDHISSPDLSTPTTYYGQAGTALICFHDSPESSAHSENPHHVFHPPAPEASTFLLFKENDTAAHSVSQVATSPRCLVDSVSTLNTVGDASVLRDYDTPSSSPIKMRSATGQIVRPVGQGNLPFSFNTGKFTLAVPCQHTPAIATSIMYPVETCERLGCDIYTLTCDRQTSTSSLRFTKTGAPDIEILGTFAARRPHIPLMTQLVNSLCSLTPCRPIPLKSQDLAHERLSDHAHTAMHQVLRLCQRFDPTVDALSCSTGVLHLVHETVVDDITHAGCHPSKMFHVSDAVNRTLWHLRTPARLVQISKITNIPTKSICRLFFRTTHVNWRRSYYGLGNIVRLDRLAKSPDGKYARYSAQSCVRFRPPFGLCVMQSFANDVKKH
jgi:hypothetical protein